MTMGNDLARVALAQLDAFIGVWHMQASFPQAPPVHAGTDDDDAASAVFEWALGGRFVIQRSTAPHPAPDSLAIIRFDPDTASYSQHYFDSRGVVRVYAMTFDGDVWTLRRDTADFSPLDFLAALQRHIHRRRQCDRGALGDVSRRVDVESRLRPQLFEGPLTQRGAQCLDGPRKGSERVRTRRQSRCEPGSVRAPALS